MEERIKFLEEEVASLKASVITLIKLCNDLIDTIREVIKK